MKSAGDEVLRDGYTDKMYASAIPDAASKTYNPNLLPISPENLQFMLVSDGKVKPVEQVAWGLI